MKTLMMVLRLCLGASAVCLAGWNCDRAQAAAAQAPIQQIAATNHLPVRLTPTRGSKKLESRANSGDATSQYDLGVRYSKGDGVPVDLEEAVGWYRKAAEQGLAKAQTALGYCYYGGQGVPLNFREAVKWYRKAAEQGGSEAQYELAACYRWGEHGVPQDFAEAAKWFRKAAEQGHRRAQDALGECYADGQGVPKDPAEAAKWIRKAAEQSDALRQDILGDRYRWGQGVTQDYAEAVKWYRKAADQGNACAQCSLGECYWLGLGVKQDYGRAVKCFREALKQGFELARTDLERAEAQHDPRHDDPTQRSVAEATARGKPSGKPPSSGAVGVNTSASLSTYEMTTRRANAGDLDAQVALGVMCTKGEGVRRDIFEGRRWFLQAAKRGSKWGQYNLALYYETQVNDFQTAAAWCRKAAEQGLPEAQDHLGRMYATGKGVGCDVSEAKRWFQRAAAQGVTVELDKLRRYSALVAAEREAQDEAWRMAAWQAQQRAIAPISLQLPQTADRGIANSVSARAQLLSQIVSDYHRDHTYRKDDSFVCGDMASDVWNIVQTKGISAKIMIGNVERDVTSPRDYNHAWVLAELSAEESLALEATGGYVVRYEENARYYSGHAFSTPRQLKEYSSLAQQSNAANLKYNNAVDDYNQMVGQYNSADAGRRIWLDRELVQRKAIANQRKADLNELDGRLRTLLSEGN